MASTSEGASNMGIDTVTGSNPDTDPDPGPDMGTSIGAGASAGVDPHASTIRVMISSLSSPSDLERHFVTSVSSDGDSCSTSPLSASSSSSSSSSHSSSSPSMISLPPSSSHSSSSTASTKPLACPPIFYAYNSGRGTLVLEPYGKGDEQKKTTSTTSRTSTTSTTSTGEATIAMVMDLSKCIGRGSDSDVYETKDPWTKRNCALKKLLRHESSSHSSPKTQTQKQEHGGIQPLHEVNAMMLMHHPNIIRPESILVFPDGRVGWTMPLYHCSVYSEIQARHPYDTVGWSWDHRRRILFRFICAVAALHDRGILHCDLHPDNCLWRPSDTHKEGDVAIADLGICMHVHDPHDPVLPLSRKMLRYVRPPEYSAYLASGELKMGHPGFQAQSETWSLGQLAIFLFCGCFLYDTTTQTRYADAVQWQQKVLAPGRLVRLSIRTCLTRALHAHGKDWSTFIELVASMLHLNRSRRPIPQELVYHSFFHDLEVPHGRSVDVPRPVLRVDCGHHLDTMRLTTTLLMRQYASFSHDEPSWPPTLLFTALDILFRGHFVPLVRSSSTCATVATPSTLTARKASSAAAVAVAALYTAAVFWKDRTLHGHMTLAEFTQAVGTIRAETTVLKLEPEEVGQAQTELWSNCGFVVHRPNLLLYQLDDPVLQWQALEVARCEPAAFCALLQCDGDTQVDMGGSGDEEQVSVETILDRLWKSFGTHAACARDRVRDRITHSDLIRGILTQTKHV